MGILGGKGHIEGSFEWLTPKDKRWREIWEKYEYRGIEITGSGHDVCYNRIAHFKDVKGSVMFPAAAALGWVRD